MAKIIFSKEARNLIAQLNKGDWEDDEARRKLVRDILNLPHVPARSVVDILFRTYLDTNPKLKSEKLLAIEEILIKLHDPRLVEDLVNSAQSVIDGQTREVIFKVLYQTATNDDDHRILKLLKNKDPDLREGALRVVRKIGNRSTFYKLKDMLAEPGWYSKLTAYQALFDLDTNEALRVLKEAISSSLKRDIDGILEILATSKDRAVVEFLVTLASHQDHHVRQRVAETLGLYKDAIAQQALANLLGDDVPRVQHAAAESLLKVADSKVNARVITTIAKADPRLKVTLLKILSKTGDHGTISTLINCLKDKDIFVRQEAVNAMSKLGKSKAINMGRMVIDMMRDSDVNIRRAAADILSKLKDRTLMHDLFTFLRDEDWWVREQVAAALGEIGDESLTDMILPLLDDKDENLRRYAVEIVAKIKPQKAFKPLLNLVKDNDWWIRERAIEALGSIGGAKVLPLLKKLLATKSLQGAAVKALGELGDTAAVEPLVEMTSEQQTKDVRLEALNALSRYEGDPRVTEILKQLSTDTDKEVRLKARELLKMHEQHIDIEQIKKMGEVEWKRSFLSILDQLLVEVREKNASDLIISSDFEPMMKYYGEVIKIREKKFSEDEVVNMLQEIMAPAQWERFERNMDLDMAYETPLGDRFRVNIYQQRLGISAVFRVIPEEAPTIRGLGMPEIFERFTQLHQGMILVTGPATCGKTTTVAALINHANETRNDHIITIEDPIEYIHSNKNCLVNQREVGRNTDSFAVALRAALREDPDIILVGELRDLETIQMAITAAETGHLVFSTMHTTSTAKTIDRIIDAYPPTQQPQIRTMLSESLKAVISQQLVRKRDGGVTAVFEILVSTPSLSKLIRDGKTYQVASVLTTGRGAGMQTMDQALGDLVKQGIISGEEAFRKAFDKKEFEHFVRKKA